ncbi:MAG: rhodanese-like domain-containing protein [Pseudomonadota bacterium]
MAGRIFLMLLLALVWQSPAMAAKPVAPELVEGTMRVSAEQAVELATGMAGLVIIDNRYHEEYVKGHIEGALNLVGPDIERAELARVAPDRDTPLLFYCNGESCLRSAGAAQKAAQWGYRRIYWFRGGWLEWMAKKLPVSK